MFPPDQTAELGPPGAGDDVSATTEDRAVIQIPLAPGDTRDLSEEATRAIHDARRRRWAVSSVIAERYTLERRLGGGAMGEVWLASDRLLKKPVALKVLRADLAENRGTVRRFLREVALAHSVTHPNVVRIYDTGESEGLPYFSMEYLQGQTLDELIGNHTREEGETPPMTLREIRDISYEILSGLESAHNAGIVHRDLKPANVMLTHRGAIVMDFGVAGFDTLPATRPDPGEARSLVRTEAGTIFGSPAYMAPELWDGAPATVQSDLYSFGAMLYQMLTGRLPIDAPNAREFLKKLQSTKPTPVRSVRKDTPRNLARLVGICMSHDPDDRPSSAAVAARLVAPFRKLVRLRTAAVGAGIIAVAVLAVGVWWGFQPIRGAMGLPDELARRDLAAVVRNYDVGDYQSATSQLTRLEQRAPNSAAVAFWRATLAHDLGDEAGRRAHCDSSGDLQTWAGSAHWKALADSACAPSYGLAASLRATLDDRGTRATEPFLPLAATYSLVPRLEAAREPSDALKAEAQRVLSRLARAPSMTADVATPVRWRLARVELEVALGHLDAARESLEVVAEEAPEAPLVVARAAWLYHHLGEADRARERAEQVARIDPRPSMQLMLDEGRLGEAATWLDSVPSHPAAVSMLDMWCGYAFRFELERLPARCRELGPGLVRTLWAGGQGSEADHVAMNPLGRDLANRQHGINYGECADRTAAEIVLTHASAPYENYRTQLDITAALCPIAPRRGDLQTARHLADQLVAVDPDDPWSVLLQAQVDEALGAASLANSKRQLVAERWRGADAQLPLVRRLRESLNMLDDPADAPLPSSPGEEAG